MAFKEKFSCAQKYQEERQKLLSILLGIIIIIITQDFHELSFDALKLMQGSFSKEDGTKIPKHLAIQLPNINGDETETAKVTPNML